MWRYHTFCHHLHTIVKKKLRGNLQKYFLCEKAQHSGQQWKLWEIVIGFLLLWLSWKRILFIKNMQLHRHSRLVLNGPNWPFYKSQSWSVNYTLRFLGLMSMSKNYMHCVFCILILNIKLWLWFKSVQKLGERWKVNISIPLFPKDIRQSNLAHRWGPENQQSY